DADALGRALAALADRHPGLRTTFGLAGDRPEARINPQARLDLRIEEIAGPERGAAEARLAAEAYRPFDLETGPLLRLLVLRTEGGRQDKPGNVHILLAVHHIVADFASVAVLLRDLGLLYDAETGGLHADLVPLTATPADFARAEERLLRGASGERLRRYWQRQLGGELPLLDLPTDRPRPPLLTFAGDRCRRLIEGATSDALEACAASHDATVFMLLLAAFQTLLHRYSGQRDLTVGTPMALRDNAEYTDLIGYLVNPVVLRGDLRHDPDFIGLLGSTRKVVHGALVHRAYPFPKLVEDLQAGHDPGRSPLFQAMLVWHADRLPAAQGLAGLALGVPGLAVDLGGLRLESMALPCRSAQFDLSLEAARLEEGLVTALSFNSDLYDAATAQRLLGHLATLLTGIAADPTRRLSELPLLTEGERRQLFSAWEPQADSDACLHDLFAAAAAEHAEREAVIDGERRITYRQLARCARRLANHLQQLGVGPEVRVGLCAGRSVEMLVGLLGILTAGGAYVPLDPAYPRRRLAFILEDSRVSLLLLGGGVSVDLPVHGAREVDLDAFGPDADLGQESSSLAQQTVPDNLAYFIYTSGSTGRPKGVSITHRSAAARVCWAAEIFSPTELQGMLAATSICFDLSVFEIFAPLCHGGRVILADHALGLPTLPAASEVTLINTVPSSLAELVSGAARLPAGVRTVNLAGEPLSRRLVQRIYQHSDAERVLDLYGPSEDTTYSTFAEAKRDDPREPTIGRPLRATRVALVDAGLRLMARGLVGEIVIGGVGLARGYLDRPGLTAQRFQPDPFGSHFGHRLYRTGDLGRLRPSGDLEYLGRTDHQVKIRGFRIELGEIETVLEGHPQVAEAVAVARRDKSGDPLLVAYLAVTNGGGPAAAELRRYLGAQLPAFMVPQAFVTLDALPRSPNGKIDRSALPAPDADAAGPQTAFVAPSTEVELLLAEIWCEVLGVERVGIHDDFFDLGGHSLKATRVLARVSEVFQVDLPVRSLLESPTILGLTEAIARQLLAEADPEALVELGI
ncbi:MAG: amino acid adenylation domain-containing protein, partial [Acidobacteriota bacterium]